MATVIMVAYKYIPPFVGVFTSAALDDGIGASFTLQSALVSRSQFPIKKFWDVALYHIKLWGYPHEITVSFSTSDVFAFLAALNMYNLLVEFTISVVFIVILM